MFAIRPGGVRARGAALALALVALLAAGAALLLSPAHAAIITVNTTADELNADGDCALREAIRAANTDTAVDACLAGSGADTIVVPAGIYTLSIAGAGEDANATGDLDITASLTLNGAGAATTIIQACDSSGGACTGIDRVFDSFFGGSLEISGVTIQNGASADPGGGIRNNGTFTLTGTLTLTSSTVSGNSALAGGAIYNIDSTVTLTTSTVSGNTARIGGGILNDFDSTLTVNSSTVSNNTTGSAGGGIDNDNGGTLTLNNSTLSGNVAASGGGISSSGTVTTKNTIVANNVGGDCRGGITSAGHNLSSDSTCGFTAGGDLQNTNPLLGPLANNGGPTQTHALLAGSPAIDAGSADCPPPATDQRGVARPQGPRCDIGAYEFEVPPTPTSTPTPSATATPTHTPTPTATPPPPVGGISLDLRAEELSLEAAESSGRSRSLLVGGSAALMTSVIALGTAGWHARRRRQ